MNAKRLASLPGKIQLGYKTFTLKVVDAGCNSHSAGSMEFLPGVITIENDRNFADHEIVNTAIHEPLHAIWKMYELPDDEHLEERIVTVFANGLTDLFQRNPDFINWILSTLEAEKRAA